MSIGRTEAFAIVWQDDAGNQWVGGWWGCRSVLRMITSSRGGRKVGVIHCKEKVDPLRAWTGS